MLQHEKRRKEALGQLRMRDLVEDTRQSVEYAREHLDLLGRVLRAGGRDDTAAFLERELRGLLENVEELIERTGY